MILTAVRLGGRPGMPVLVLGPDDGASVSAQWGGAARLLGADFQVIGWDLPGQGYNRLAVQHEPSVAEFARDVVALIEEMADSFEPVPFHYAGLGVGAEVGSEIRRTSSSRVLSLSRLESPSEPEEMARLVREGALGPSEPEPDPDEDARALALERLVEALGEARASGLGEEELHEAWRRAVSDHG